MCLAGKFLPKFGGLICRWCPSAHVSLTLVCDFILRDKRLQQYCIRCVFSGASFDSLYFENKNWGNFLGIPSPLNSTKLKCFHVKNTWTVCLSKASYEAGLSFWPFLSSGLGASTSRFCMSVGWSACRFVKKMSKKMSKMIQIYPELYMAGALLVGLS